MHREWEAGVDDRPNGAEQALLVIAERLRCAGDEDDPAAVTVDVAFEKRDVVVVRRLFNRPREHLNRLGGGVRALCRDDLVGTRVADECDCRVTVLSFERSDLEQLGAQRRRDCDLDRKPLEIR